MWATNFTAYLGNDPTTCNNCHVMDAAYEGWYHAAHRLHADCVDCHTPHAFIPKYIVKAQSGMNHVFHFTMGSIPVPLRAKPATDRIIQANCIRCHSQTVSMVADGQADAGRYCFSCHTTVAHGSRGISLLPYQDTSR
jgi:cytochrome c nitrite reductase small subunit